MAVKVYIFGSFKTLYDVSLNFSKVFNLCQQLKKVKNDAFYLADIFKRFNDVNLRLREANKTLIGCLGITIHYLLTNLNYFIII